MKREIAKRTRAGGLWTEAKFWQFIRSALRNASQRWPAKIQAKNKLRRPYDGPNKRQKWEYRCEGCGRWVIGSKMQMDHIDPVGSLKRFEDLPGFARRLFCEARGYRGLCDLCHPRARNNPSAVVVLPPPKKLFPKPIAKPCKGTPLA